MYLGVINMHTVVTTVRGKTFFFHRISSLNVKLCHVGNENLAVDDAQEYQVETLFQCVITVPPRHTKNITLERLFFSKAICCWTVTEQLAHCCRNKPDKINSFSRIPCRQIQK